MKHSPPPTGETEKSYLDILYADRRPREMFRWPAHRDYLCCTKPVAVFDTWNEASIFAMQHDLFMGEPKRRAA